MASKLLFSHLDALGGSINYHNILFERLRRGISAIFPANAERKEKNVQISNYIYLNVTSANADVTTEVISQVVSHS